MEAAGRNELERLVSVILRGTMKHLDLFSGIGGFALAAQWAGFETVAFCEIDEFARSVLQKNFPGVRVHGDIKELSGDEYAGVELITGGYPCQPFSVAGKRRGAEDDRHLWPEMLRVIREARPRYVVGENVYGLATWNGGLVLDEVLSSLEDAGYEVAPPLVIPAAGVGAPHRRDRVWVVANAQRDTAKLQRGPRPISGAGAQNETEAQQRQRCRHAPGDSRPPVADATSARRGSRRTAGESGGRELVRRLVRVADGLSYWMDEPGIPRVTTGQADRTARLRAIGGAIVPQVAAEIFRALDL